jgi:hypothetical protein
MKYRVVREEHGKTKPMMSCDFEDIHHFMVIAQSPQYRILCDGKDVTSKYAAKPIKWDGKHYQQIGLS